MSLMPQIMGGDPGDSANLPANEFFTQGFEGTAYSGVKFDNDGNIYERQYGGGWSSIGAWLLNGVNTAFYIAASINSGTLTTDAGAGPLQLNTDRVYDVQRTSDGEKLCIVSFRIVDSGDTTTYASRTYRLETNRGLL